MKHKLIEIGLVWLGIVAVLQIFALLIVPGAIVVLGLFCLGTLILVGGIAILGWVLEFAFKTVPGLFGVVMVVCWAVSYLF
jgi:hypothetical protein